MMSKSILIPVLAALCLSALASAQGAPAMTVEEMVFCTAVQDRAPSGVDTAFASIVENVFCFSRVAGAADTVSVTHVWYFGDREMGRVELPVRASTWRTWSSKKILPEWQGVWRVDILSPAGDVLKSATFAVRP